MIGNRVFIEKETLNITIKVSLRKLHVINGNSVSNAIAVDVCRLRARKQTAQDDNRRPHGAERVRNSINIWRQLVSLSHLLCDGDNNWSRAMHKSNLIPEPPTYTHATR